MPEEKKLNEHSFFDLPRNPKLTRDDLKILTGMDFGPRRTVGDIVGELRAMDRRGATDDELCDHLDQQMLWGSWKEIVERLPGFNGRKFLADIRGLVIAAIRGGRDR